VEVENLRSRIQERLVATEQSSQGAALKAGLSRDFVRDLLSGKSRHPRADTLMKLARALECDPGYLLGLMEAPNGSRKGDKARSGAFRLPIRYEAAAGSWLAVDDLSQDEPPSAPAIEIKGYARAPQWLERVRGDSMDRLMPSGALAHVVDAIALGYAPRHGDVVVVLRSRAQGAFLERTVKQVELGPGGAVELWPRSHNPRWREALSLTAGADPAGDLSVEIVGKVVQAYLPLTESV
jgi:transcriptional regulator with XRE-family HTH domain